MGGVVFFQRGYYMQFTKTENGNYSIITISESLNIISDLTELKQVIEDLLNEGRTKIAVRFLNADYLYSGAISVLVTLYKQVNEKNGILCIIESNRKIHDLLDQMCITNIIPVSCSPVELPE